MTVASGLRIRTCRRRRSSCPLLSRKTLRATCLLNRFVRDGKSSNASVAGGRLGMSGLIDCQSDAAQLFLYQSIKPIPKHDAHSAQLASCTLCRGFAPRHRASFDLNLSRMNDRGTLDDWLRASCKVERWTMCNALVIQCGRLLCCVAGRGDYV